MNPRWWLPLSAFACASAIPLPALAQDAAAAAALYDRGLSDMLAGKLSSACPALAESYRLDPLPGALFTLAECEGKAGRCATAVARYDEYLATYARLPAKEKAGQKGRNKLAEAARRKLLPNVPTVTIRLPASAPEGTRVTARWCAAERSSARRASADRSRGPRVYDAGAWWSRA